MTRLENVIDDIKNVNKHGKAWIYDDNGKIKNEVICGNVLEYLNELKDYEIEITDDEIDTIVKNGKAFNTYNWGANIDHDLQFFKMGNKIVFCVHRIGDIRGNYTDYFACEFDYEGAMYELESVTQYKDIDDRYTADINIFTECYSVYDCEKQDDIGEFYQIEVSDLLSEIKK